MRQGLSHARSFIVLEPEEDQQSHAHAPQQPRNGDEIRVNHQREADGDRFPALKASTISPCSQTDGAENETGEDIVGIEIEHGGKEIG